MNLKQRPRLYFNVTVAEWIEKELQAKSENSQVSFITQQKKMKIFKRFYFNHV